VPVLQCEVFLPSLSQLGCDVALDPLRLFLCSVPGGYPTLVAPSPQRAKRYRIMPTRRVPATTQWDRPGHVTCRVSSRHRRHVARTLCEVIRRKKAMPGSRTGLSHRGEVPACKKRSEPHCVFSAWLQSTDAETRLLRCIGSRLHS
jgi:hypothetical protein